SDLRVFASLLPRLARSTLFPYTTLFRSAAFSTVYGPFGGAFVSVCLLLFAFTSLLGTSYYGERGLQYLTGSDRWKLPFRAAFLRSEEHTSELQSRFDLVCRLLLEKKKTR